MGGDFLPIIVYFLCMAYFLIGLFLACYVENASLLLMKLVSNLFYTDCAPLNIVVQKLKKKKKNLQPPLLCVFLPHIVLFIYMSLSGLMSSKLYFVLTVLESPPLTTAHQHFLIK